MRVCVCALAIDETRRVGYTDGGGDGGGSGGGGGFESDFKTHSRKDTSASAHTHTHMALLFGLMPGHGFHVWLSILTLFFKLSLSFVQRGEPRTHTHTHAHKLEPRMAKHTSSTVTTEGRALTGARQRATTREGEREEHD